LRNKRAKNAHREHKDREESNSGGGKGGGNRVGRKLRDFPNQFKKHGGGGGPGGEKPGEVYVERKGGFQVMKEKRVKA